MKTLVTIERLEPSAHTARLPPQQTQVSWSHYCSYKRAAAVTNACQSQWQLYQQAGLWRTEEEAQGVVAAMMCPWRTSLDRQVWMSRLYLRPVTSTPSSAMNKETVLWCPQMVSKSVAFPLLFVTFSVWALGSVWTPEKVTKLTHPPPRHLWKLSTTFCKDATQWFSRFHLRHLVHEGWEGNLRRSAYSERHAPLGLQKKKKDAIIQNMMLTGSAVRSVPGSVCWEGLRKLQGPASCWRWQLLLSPESFPQRIT